MKITYVIDYLYSVNGGSERQLYRLIEGMVQRGHKVVLYVLRESDFTRNLSGFPCPVHCLGIHSILSLSGVRSFWLFRQALVCNRTDVVHGFFNDVALILPPLMIATGIKTYTSRRDMGIWYSRTRLYLLRFFRFAKTRLICNCFAVADYAHQKEWKPRKSIVVIHNGMDVLSGVTVGKNCEWAPVRERNSNIINVILVANVRPVKRIEDFIKATSLLRDGHVRGRYWIVGHLSDESYYDSLRTLLLHYHLENDFHFVGPILEPRNGLDRFDIGVLSSASEGFSNSIMEYLDAGLPVVASKVGGNKELVTDGYNGFLYEVGDYKSLAKHLLALARDSDLRKQLSVNAKETVQRFGVATMIERHEKEYAHDQQDKNKVQ